MDFAWLVIAYLLGLGASKLGLPPLVGYLAGGFVLAGFGAQSGDTLAELADLGVILLLFGVGLELRLKNLLQVQVWGGGLMHFVIVAALLTTVLGLSGFTSGPAAYLAAGLAFSSTVVAIKILEEKGEAQSYHGRIAIGVLILQDLVAVGMLALAGVQAPSPWAVLLLALPLAQPLLKWLLLQTNSPEIQLLFGLVLALGGAELFEICGISGELGAVVLGFLLASEESSENLAHTIWGLKEAFLVAFFLQIGLTGLPSWGQLGTALLLTLLVPAKGALFFFVFVALGLRARTAFLSAAALTSYSEFALVTAEMGVAAGFLPESWLVTLALTVSLSFVIAAPLNRLAHPIFARFEPILLRFERPVPHADQEPATMGAARFLIVGMGRTGTAAYEYLANQGIRVIGIDADPARIEIHRAAGRRVLYGDAEDPALWERPRLERLNGVMLTLPDLEAKTSSIARLREHQYPGLIAATAHYPNEDQVLKKAGADLTYYPFLEAGTRLGQLVLQAINAGQEPEAPEKPAGT